MSTEQPDTAAADEPAGSRYVVGIDLGTTNSAVCYVDTDESPWRVRTFSVPQLVAPAQVEARETLPSFHYEATADEFASGALRLAWSESDDPHTAVGVLAREQGRAVPGRAVSSAKSWLCHTGVDRTAELLPWHGAADVERLSPVAVSGRYLEHVRRAWDHRFPESPLAEQDVVLTLPASFDEVARELTVQAGRRAGLPRLVLIEEPQAAFYAWIDRHQSDWEEQVEPGQKILVCDIGGGTSDFTLIRVRRGEGDSGKIAFHRVAVGEHLILGGDNLDLALAHHLERRIAEGSGVRGQESGRSGEQRAKSGELDSDSGSQPSALGSPLSPRQWAVLVSTCRQVKEDLLKADAPERLTVTLPGSGSRLIGGALQVEITRDEARGLLLDGFLPRVPLDAQPEARQSGFQEFGLPFAPDPAITRYLAWFLRTHRGVTVGDEPLPTDHDPARPDIVLFNGGFFASDVLRERLLDVLTGWFRDEAHPDWQPLILRNDRLDLAVAHGAAYYGMVRRGEGVRIAAGLARTYYVGVEGPGGELHAVCLVPAGVEPGHEVEIREPHFTLRVSEPIEFPLFVSSTRLTDNSGDVVPVDPEQMKALPPIRTVLKTRGKGEGETVTVALHARLTEIGTLDLSCREAEGKRSWRLQFDVRSATQTDIAAHESAAEAEGVLSDEDWQRCLAAIDDTFGEGDDANGKPAGLAKRIAREIGLSRADWPTSLLRDVWEALMEREPGRRKSPEHEARWLNLLGFALRPGYGYAMDDWRVAETWKALQGKLVHAAPQCRAEWWVLWRRLGGGLTSGQQTALATPLLASIRPLHKQMTTGRGKGGAGLSENTHEQAEIWRMLGSFELLRPAVRVELGGMILDLLDRPKMEPVRKALAWALGRVGSRVPLYGPLNTAVPAADAAKWLTELMGRNDDDPTIVLAVMQLARRTDDRFRDIPTDLRERALAWLDVQDAPPHFLQLVEQGGRLDHEEQGLIFGESLPKGLRLG